MFDGASAVAMAALGVELAVLVVIVLSRRAVQRAQGPGAMVLADGSFASDRLDTAIRWERGICTSPANVTLVVVWACSSAGRPRLEQLQRAHRDSVRSCWVDGLALALLHVGTPTQLRQEALHLVDELSAAGSFDLSIAVVEDDDVDATQLVGAARRRRRPIEAVRLGPRVL